jgi:hypothetical protein
MSSSGESYLTPLSSAAVAVPIIVMWSK